jgi:hypothetical protein
MVKLRLPLVLAVCWLLASQSGCISLNSFLGEKRKPGYDLSMLQAQGYQLPPGGMPSTLPPSVQLTGSEFILEIRDSEKQMAAIPLDPEKGMTIEEMARKAELPDKLGRANLFIVRLTSAAPIRLDAKLNGKGQCVDPGHNYSLRPGDHVIAIGDGRTLFERFVDEQIGRDE